MSEEQTNEPTVDALEVLQVVEQLNPLLAQLAVEKVKNRVLQEQLAASEDV